jgi:hypothetical protein
MFTNRSAIIQITIVVAAIATGTALGYWLTTPSKTVPLPSPAKSETAPDISSQHRPKSIVPTSAPGDAAETADAGVTSGGLKKSLQEILQGRNSGTRTKELEEFVKGLTGSQIGDALKELRRLPEGSARDLASGLLVAHWIETDPEGALRFAAQNREYDYIASDIFQQMAADNLQSALARAQTIADPNARYQALRGVLSYMADQDPLGALRLAGTLGPFPNNEPLSQMIYRQWSAVDAPAAAAQAALDSSGSGWRSPVGQVLRNWANQDPLAAIAWTNSLSDPAAQARDIGQIMRQWSRDDLNAAANWVNNASPGSMRDAAAASLAFSLSGTDPAAALGWAQSISDATERQNAVQRLSREIMSRNPGNGAAILQAAGIPQNMIPPPPNPNETPRGRRGR